MKRGLIGVALSALAWAPSVQAQASSSAPPDETVGFSFFASPPCATATDFAQGVRRRLPELHLVEQAGADVMVRVRADARTAEAVLVLLLRNGEELTRVLEADSCAAAVEAIAFVAAVALDQSARAPLVLRNAPQPESETDASHRGADSGFSAGSAGSGRDGIPSRQGASTPSRSRSRGDSAADARKPKRARQVRPEKGPNRGSRPEQGRSPQLALHLGGRLQSGAAPGPLWGAELGVTAGQRRPGVWSPSASLDVGFGWADAFEHPGGDARFRLAHVGLTVCPTRFRASLLELRVCGVGQVGWLSANGEDTLDPARIRRLWLALGVGAELGVVLAARHQLYWGGVFTWPLVRDAYRFDTDVFHRVAAVSVLGSLGYRLRFQ